MNLKLSYGNILKVFFYLLIQSIYINQVIHSNYLPNKHSRFTNHLSQFFNYLINFKNKKFL